MNDIYDPKSIDLNNSLAPLLSQVRMAMLSGVDEEFLLDKEGGVARGHGGAVRHHREPAQGTCEFGL